ncbi:hypothetical protein N9901_00060 [Flavobacteriaceae bacterium]|nr:hypothetical protein [Flavobacteriaceae bacterium]
MKLVQLFAFIAVFLLGFKGSTQNSKIKILNANQTFANEQKHPGALVLNGNVKMLHAGALLTCKKALYYKEANKLHAYGSVKVNQGDTLVQTSNHLQYNANTKKAISWGDVIVKDSDVTLTTDTLHFDRNTQIMYYDCFGTIKSDTNILTSQKGEYFASDKKLTARENVTVLNESMQLKTSHLDYYTTSGKSYLYGPSTIINEESEMYTEKGIYDTRLSLGYLLKNSVIYHDNREIAGDSLYYNQTNSFASGTGNLVITDTINNLVIKGDYGEIFRAKDSIIIPKNPVAISIVEKDSMFVHGDTLSISGTSDNRLMKVYHHVKFFKSDISGKCDSLVTFQDKGITEMYKNPVLWTTGNQITGDSIQMLSNPITHKLDSLKILKNAFVVQKDSTGYNQIKGRNMFGKFKEQKLNTLLTKGNGAVINYARDEEGLLSAIMKMECSNILFSLKDNKMNTIQFLKKPDGKTYPPTQFPKEMSLLRGFIWRENERPLSKEDIFIHD